jgi:hypothetical protein
MNGARPALSVPEVPLWRQADEWAKRAISSISGNTDVGSRLLEGADSHFYKWLAEAVGSLLPVLGKLGVHSDVIGIDTLEARLRSAVTEARAQIEWNPQFLAVASKGAVRTEIAP